MPTNLAALPSDKPIPNGKIQIKRGAADTSPVLGTGTASGTKLSDGAGGFLQITYTPVYNCFWVVRSNIMAHGYPDGAGWRRWDIGIMISPADANGVTTGVQLGHQLYDNSTVEWRSVGGSYMFKLNAGVAYTAYLASMYVSAGSLRYHTGGMWARVVGRVVGEGVV